MTRRGLRFALFAGVLAGLAFPGSAAAEQLTLTVVGNGVVTGTYGFLGGQSLECGPSEICEFEIPRLCPFLQTCPPSTPQPQTVELTASAPPSEWVFVEWSGDCSGSVTSCSVVMDQARTVTAVYRNQIGRIAFSWDANGELEIYARNADGTGEIRLTNNPARDDDPAWSPDGRRIAFVSNRDGANNSEIYVMNADGTGVTRLTNSPGSDGWPSWSPDGRRIALASTRDGLFQIFVMNADGTGTVRLTNTQQNVEPTWSPDGTRLAFLRRTGGIDDIWVMKADGSGQTNLTNDAAFEGSPAWSPDGGRIAYSTDRGDGLDKVYVMNADGTSPIPLAQGFSPTWSPDGGQIAFRRRSHLGYPAIYVMDSNGDGQIPLAEPVELSEGEPAWGRLRSQLFVERAGSGFGSVVSSPAGINCGADCSELYEAGSTQVTLTAEAANGSLFSGWSGACSGTQPTCTVTMDNSKNVTATFFLLPVSQGPAPQGPCTHTGTAGNDVIIGTEGNDIICAGKGNDVVKGGGGNDVILLGAGNDKGYGGAGKDRIVGGKGKDRLFGGAGNDTLLAKDRVKKEIVDGGAGRRDRCTADRGDIKRRCP
jgi:hypothetical protein